MWSMDTNVCLLYVMSTTTILIKRLSKQKAQNKQLSYLVTERESGKWKALVAAIVIQVQVCI